MRCICTIVLIFILVIHINSEELAYKECVALKKEVVSQQVGSLKHLVKVAQNAWGNNYTIILQVKSEALEQVAINNQVYYIGFNKATTSGYLPNYRSIVVSKGTMALINTDDEALTFLNNMETSAETLNQAFLLINAFADLRNYTILKRGNNLINEKYTQVIRENNEEWFFSISFNVNLVGYKHIQYKFKITKLGDISILSNTLICKYAGGK